ncbi:AMP-binding protein [Aromatoleum evansii]|uniref:AMP-binding protein n=1 Tax=Aromatoleum evansii TaxID=59406 RepID=A0ABZ1AVU8_AROEV|nr:AMP-binding protein [Aromatoleum toluclasticum]MBD5803202.1 Long-chain-fatty-acid--CoA ligase [Azoarcus sp. Aa7]WRL48791.1 AMP-binding protein [Aromatoleum evansii]
MGAQDDALLAELPQRLNEIPRRWAAATPDAVAVSEGGVTWTWHELAATVDEGAALLRRLDVRPGDRVMIVGENCTAQIALIFALAQCDAWVVNVNARLSPREIDVIREHSGARRVIYTVAVSPDAAAHAARHEAARTTLARFGEIAIGALNESCTPEPVEPDGASQVAALIYTTGTTGHPKGVMLTHRNLLFIAAVSSRLRQLRPQDCVYGVLPISHVYGLASVMLGTLYAGAALHVVPRYSPQALIDALQDDGITVLQGVPAMYARLLEFARGKWTPEKTRLRFIYAGGSPLDPTLKDEVEQFFGQTLHNGYGMTESSPTISQTRIDAPRRDTSVGQVIPGIEIRVVDKDGADVPGGEPGELWVRGPNVMKGYYHEPELTADTMRPGGWLNTGDVVRRDAGGALFVVGRTKELIIRSGFNVYPVEVEAALNSHPAVTQSAVVGREVGEGNEEVVAFVELDPTRSVSIEDLQGYLAGQLSPYKCPSEIVVMQAMPAAATGKILKGQLKQQAQDMYRARAQDKTVKDGRPR